MHLRHLQNLTREIIERNKKGKRSSVAFLRRDNLQPSIQELIQTCNDICRTTMDWYRMIKAGTGLRIPREFLDRKQTQRNIEFLISNAHPSDVPTYLLLRTYDVCYANAAIRQMLAFDDEKFHDWVNKQGVNILLAMITPSDPLYKTVAHDPKSHEFLVRTNVNWFIKDNEMFFRVPEILTAIAKSPEFQSQLSPWGYEDDVGQYIRRVQEIVSLLNHNPWANEIFKAMPVYLDAATNYTPSQQSFELLNAAGTPIFLRPETGSPIGADFFPQVITYQHYKQKEMPELPQVETPRSNRELTGKRETDVKSVSPVSRTKPGT